VIAEAPLLLPAAGLLGAVFGSFAATATGRAARGAPWAAGRSRCDHCGAPVGALQNVPIASFVLAGGACRACGGVIDRAQFAGEAAGAVSFAAAAFVSTGADLPLLLLLAGTLLLLALVDYRTQRLPDGLTAVAATAGFGLSALAGPQAMIAGLVAAGAGFLVMEALRCAYRARTGQEGLGFGDVKLAAALGLWLGGGLAWTIALASGLGLALAAASGRGRHDRAPFGPALAAAAWIVGCGRALWPTLFP
jgi:leader peptidase (prepilin peptidase)/N-methyltransferase